MDSQSEMREDHLFLQAFVPAIYWNDVDCYYWAAPVRLPSGHWCEFKVSKDGQKWKPRIIPTFQEYKEMKERVSLQAEEREKWLQEQRRKREMEKEIGVHPSEHVSVD